MRTTAIACLLNQTALNRGVIHNDTFRIESVLKESQDAGRVLWQDTDAPSVVYDFITMLWGRPLCSMVIHALFGTVSMNDKDNKPCWSRAGTRGQSARLS